MMGFERSDDYQPLFWVQGRPVHVTAFLVILHVGALMVNSILQGRSVLWLRLDCDAVLHHWQLWRPITYAFAHILADLNDSLWFLFEMFLLFNWGREVEKYFGRKTFIALYLAMLLTAPAVLLTISAFSHVNVADNIIHSRSDILHFGVFILFVAIYPGVEIFFGVAAKWMAIALLAVWTAAFVATQHLMVPVLWATTFVAFFGARYASVGSEAFGTLGNWKPQFSRKTARSEGKIQVRARRAVDTRSAGDDSRGGNVHDSIDPLLDKISKHGLGSLTHSERALLEKARVSLLRKDRGD